ncbi:helix-turn-helix domain-containing protein [Paraburkholderia unamae]|uniref:Helix-turn-helix domain-containing protein n=1 Tax=Paraburkholderia unamae TaxID=219649 RepID=A0ACC6RVU5_9BURK
MMETDDTNAEAVAISNRVRELMGRHGVAKRSQASKLSEVLQLSFSAASRKLKGQLPWDVSQLRAIAAEFGESASVLVDVSASESAEPQSSKHEATLFFGREPESCTAWIDDSQEIHRSEAGAFVARRTTAGSWLVYRTTEAPAGALYAVRLIEIRDAGPRVRRPNVAILDDDKRHHTADSLAENFRAHGFDAVPFTDADALREALKEQVFDGFVIDWILGAGETAEPLIREIRRGETASRDAAIFILTGKLKDGVASEEDITRISVAEDCTCLEKPVRAGLLATDLARAIKTRYAS